MHAFFHKISYETVRFYDFRRLKLKKGIPLFDTPVINTQSRRWRNTCALNSGRKAVRKELKMLCSSHFEWATIVNFILTNQL